MTILRTYVAIWCSLWGGTAASFSICGCLLAAAIRLGVHVDIAVFLWSAAGLSLLIAAGFFALTWRD